MTKPTTFEEAKALADQTYINFWEDKSNDVTKNWTDADYASLVEPTMESYLDKYGRTQERRVLPKGYDEYKEYQDRINAGPLDFSSEETHKMLINPPSNRGYGKKQSWISEDDPLRQAVEAQADVMKDFLDDAGVPIVQKYEDLEGFDRPDSFRGEGVYLNTGTAAHIDWNAGLKRMQQYQSSPDAELGTYSQVFVRPDPEGISGPLAFVGAVTGNPWISAASSLAAGGDIGDIIKGAAKGYVGDVVGDVVSGFTADIPVNLIEDTLANVGIDADLFGLDPNTFTEGLGNVQGTLLKGGSGKEALLKEFGGEALDALGVDLPEFELPDTGVIGDIRDLGRRIDDTLLQPIKESVETVTAPIEDLSTPLKEAIETVGEPIVDVVDEIIDAVDSPLGDALETAVSGLGGMMSGARKPSQVEGLFDKELFKFDTEIKSTQELLSPMMNLRKYG